AIDVRAFQAVVSRSQDYLPTAELPRLDLVLVDGDHAFPAPFVDWYYASARLKVGGLMIVDDIQIATGGILAAFLAVQPKWETVLVRPERFAVYRKQTELPRLDYWMSQPFLRNSYPTAAVHLVVKGQPTVRELQSKLEATRIRLQERTTERDQAREANQRAV